MATATLKQLLQRPADRAPMITITGDAGVGKTTLAASFPKPVFLRLEDGVESIPASRRPYSFPLATTYADALAYARQLVAEKHPFQTLVIDSVTRLAAVIESEIVASDPRNPASINQALGGYGAGVSAAAERHRLLQRELFTLNERGMAIICIAHSTVETFDPPDGDSYSRFILRLDKRTTAVYIDDADAVVYVKLKTQYVTKANDDRKRARTDGTRVLIMHPTVAHVAKNRYGVEGPLDWNDPTSNPLLDVIPFYNGNK